MSERGPDTTFTAHLANDRSTFIEAFGFDPVPLVVALICVIGAVLFYFSRKQVPTKQSWRTPGSPAQAVSGSSPIRSSNSETQSVEETLYSEGHVEPQEHQQVQAPAHLETPPILEASIPVEDVQDSIPTIETTTIASSPKSPKKTSRKSEPATRRSSRLRGSSPPSPSKLPPIPTLKTEVKEEKDSSDSDYENRPPQSGTPRRTPASRKSDLPLTPRRSARLLKVLLSRGQDHCKV